MRVQKQDRFKRVVIAPGEYYAAGGTVTISTLLGSCVATCLFDPVNQIIGMNHFLLSRRRLQPEAGSHALGASRYGVHAMELVINKMLSLGAERKFLKAKAFGGASIYREKGRQMKALGVGEHNVKFIREFLETENIPLLAESLGGPCGRVIHFSNGEFAVYMRKIDPQRSIRVAERDRKCWLKAIHAQKKAIPEVDIWF